jgi:hypothetical protein
VASRRGVARKVVVQCADSEEQVTTHQLRLWVVR